MVIKMNSILQNLMLPSIYPYIDELLKSKNLGVHNAKIRICEVQTGAHTLHNGPCADRFKILIPYAMQTLTWQLMFFGNSADSPPDILFDDKSFFPDFDSIKAFQSWSIGDHKSLFRLIQELINCYKKHQLNLIEEYRFSRLQFEYSSLMEQDSYYKHNVEIQLDKKDPKGPVNFLIKLPLNLSSVTAIPGYEHLKEEYALLLITFQAPDGNKVSPQLLLSQGLEEIFRALSYKLPFYPNEGLLFEYVPAVCKNIQNKLDQIINGHQKKKEFFGAFIKRYQNCVLEYDCIEFEKMSFIFEWKNFYFVLNITVPRFFPEEKPTLTFQSIYHLSNDQPFSASFDDYPYSPRWSANEMIERFRKFILEHIQQFQKSSIRTIK